MTEKVTVLGAGTMGHGIAQLYAQAGYDVFLYDIKAELYPTRSPEFQRIKYAN